MRSPPVPALASARPDATELVRQHLQLQGAVQGVGFRPWCAQHAGALGLSGWVRNDSSGLQCEVQGQASQVQAFETRLRQSPPPLAHISHLASRSTAPVPAEHGFRIEASDGRGPMSTLLPPDTAACDDCLRELFDPTDRRHRYAFINCTQCGPRFTVTARLPYDRPQTSLAPFPLCPACDRDYRDPADRRFHAQASACPVCGPRLSLLDARGQRIVTADPLRAAVQRLRAGEVLALKSVGGYHLVCDATQAAPLHRLRTAKQRADKPFAVMAPTLASARRWVQLEVPGQPESARPVAKLLASPRRPILLLPCQAGVAAAHPLVAPGLDEWGLMLPSAPLHQLLFHEWLGAPAGRDWLEQAHDTLLVMTSANPGGEPLVIGEDEAVQRLSGLADAFLVHDRAILARCDDSVRRPMGLQPDASGQPRLFAPFVRRARGHVPEPIELPGVDAHAPSVLATGAWMKNTVCLTRGREAFVSPHLGDLEAAASRRAWVEAVERLLAFLGVRPQAVVHDLHPDFFSTTQGQALAQHWGVPALAVQHHHAHAEAVRSEHGERAPGLALLLDGVGLGSDGGAWGGELLHLDGAVFRRLAHLPTLALAGGDRAAREPWRLGAAWLHALGRGAEIPTRYALQPAAATVQAALRRGLNCPPTSSVGRWFDGAASLLGLAQHNTHEAAAAMALEAAAARHGADAPWEDGWRLDAQGHLQLDGLMHRLADTPTSADAVACGAARFHATLVHALAAWVTHHAHAQGLHTVALGGGCFINRLLRNGLVGCLRTQGLRVLEAEALPCGDGGLSLGQAAIALRLLSDPESSRLPQDT